MIPRIYPTDSAEYNTYFKEYRQKYDIGNQEAYASMEPEEVESVKIRQVIESCAFRDTGRKLAAIHSWRNRYRQRAMEVHIPV